MKTVYGFLLLLLVSPSFGQEINNCSLCSTTILTLKQIESKSSDEISLLKNEVFARKGYVFNDRKLTDYFSTQKWYHPIENQTTIKFNTIENQNILLFQKRIKYLDNERKELIASLKQFKKMVLSNDLINLKKHYGFSYGKYDAVNLNKVIHKIDLNDINWYKNKGLNEVQVDNGFVKIAHAIYIEGNDVHFEYSYWDMSEIIDDFGVFTNYYSEDEFANIWKFKFSNGKLKFNGLSQID